MPDGRPNADLDNSAGTTQIAPRHQAIRADRTGWLNPMRQDDNRRQIVRVLLALMLVLGFAIGNSHKPVDPWVGSAQSLSSIIDSGLAAFRAQPHVAPANDPDDAGTLPSRVGLADPPPVALRPLVQIELASFHSSTRYTSNHPRGPPDL